MCLVPCLPCVVCGFRISESWKATANCLFLEIIFPNYVAGPALVHCYAIVATVPMLLLASYGDIIPC